MTHRIMSVGDLSQHLHGGKLWLLSKFILDWQYLEVGGALLPSLVELYQWLHTNIAHLLTYKQASSKTISDVINLAIENLDKQSGKHIKRLYEKVKKEYNSYVELIRRDSGTKAACRNMVSDDIPILYFLTGAWYKTCMVYL